MKWLKRTSQVAAVPHLLITWHVNYKAIVLTLWRDQDIRGESFHLKSFPLLSKTPGATISFSLLETMREQCRDVKGLKGPRTESSKAHIQLAPIYIYKKKERNDCPRHWQSSRDRNPPVPEVNGTVQLSARTRRIVRHGLITKPSSALWRKPKTLI